MPRALVLAMLLTSCVARMAIEDGGVTGGGGGSNSAGGGAAAGGGGATGGGGGTTGGGGGAAACGALPACAGALQCRSAATTGVGFDDQQDRLVAPAGAWPASTSSWTFASWVRIAVDRNEFSAFFTIEQPAGHSVEYNELVTLADGTTLVFYDHVSGAAVTLGQLTVGTWYFAAVSVGPGGALSTWLAPEGGALVKVTGTAAVLDHIEMSYLGASNFAFTEFVNGSMTRARLWNGVLSDAEIAAEFTSAAPVRTAGLIGDWRLSAAATAGVDSSGLAHSLTLDFGATHATVSGPALTGCY